MKRRAAVSIILFIVMTLCACTPAAVSTGQTAGPPPQDIILNHINLHYKSSSQQPPWQAQPESGHATIAFTFDDGYSSDYKLAYPILKKYGIRGTSYIIGKYPDNNVPNTLSWDQIREMYADGWDFGCHTYEHKNLKRMSTENIKLNMLMENATFVAHGLPAPDIMAFPYGDYNQKAIEAMKPYRKQMRKAFYTDKLLFPNTIDPYGIDCVSADMGSHKHLQAKEKLVDKACQQNAIIVFRVHCMYSKKRNDMGRWTVQTDSRLFEQLVQYCVQKGCTFVTMHGLMDLYQGNQ